MYIFNVLLRLTTQKFLQTMLAKRVARPPLRDNTHWSAGTTLSSTNQRTTDATAIFVTLHQRCPSFTREPCTTCSLRHMSSSYLNCPNRTVIILYSSLLLFTSTSQITVEMSNLQMESHHISDFFSIPQHACGINIAVRKTSDRYRLYIPHDEVTESITHLVFQFHIYSLYLHTRNRYRLWLHIFRN